MRIFSGDSGEALYKAAGLQGPNSETSMGSGEPVAAGVSPSSPAAGGERVTSPPICPGRGCFSTLFLTSLLQRIPGYHRNKHRFLHGNPTNDVLISCS